MIKSRNKKTNNLIRKKYNNFDIEYKKTTLPNGIRVVTEKVPGIESVALGVNIDVGSRDDYPDKRGISHFLEHAAFRRTEKMSSRKIATQFESVGAYTNAFTTHEQTCFYVRTLNKHLKKCLRILSEMINQPLFVEKDIEKERTIILDEIAGYEDDPEELIFEKADTLLYEGHQLSNSILGYNETVKSISIADLVKFRKEQYTPDRIIISIAGNIEHEQIVKKIEDLFNLQDKASNLKRVQPDIPKIKSVTEEKGFSQTHFVIAKRLRPIDIEDRYPISLINVLLGDGMSSRLYQNIRERLGFTYSIYSSIQSHSDSGAIYVYGASDKENSQKSIDAIYKEFQKIRTNYFRKSEFKRAQEQLKSGLIMDLESMTSRMLNISKKESLKREYESISQMISNIDNLKYESLEELVDFYFDENWWQVIFDK